MQKNFKWVFFAFTLILATMLPMTVYASTFSYDDLPQGVKDEYSKDSQFAYGFLGTFEAVVIGNLSSGAGSNVRISYRSLDSSGKLMDVNSMLLPDNTNILYSTYDIKNPDGSVFFSKPMPPIPKALSQVLPNLLNQAKKILPVGLVVLSALLVVSSIPKVLYRLF